MNASESIRKNRRTWVARPPVALGVAAGEIAGYGANGFSRELATENQPLPGESAERVPESESTDRQAEDGQAR